MVWPMPCTIQSRHLQAIVLFPKINSKCEKLLPFQNRIANIEALQCVVIEIDFQMTKYILYIHRILLFKLRKKEYKHLIDF